MWLRQESDLFDVVIIDFPDPNNYGLGKLYTTHFYRMLRQRMASGSVLTIQSTSPLYSPSAYWCIVRTLQHEGFEARPYHTYIPAFGEWGYVLAGLDARPEPAPLPSGLRYLTDDTLDTMFHFPLDMGPRDGPINRLDNQVLVQLYEEDWQRVLAQ